MNQTLARTKYYDCTDMQASRKFGRELHNLIRHKKYPEQEVIFLCIGTDRATGDCLGPLIGYKLKHSAPDSVHTFGTLDQPVHAQNLPTVLEQVYRDYYNPFVIAIDACLGIPSHIGYITLSSDSLKPGEGVSKTLPVVGDISVTGIVNHAISASTMVLTNTRLATVMCLADTIYEGILYCLAREY